MAIWPILDIFEAFLTYLGPILDPIGTFFCLLVLFWPILDIFEGGLASLKLILSHFGPILGIFRAGFSKPALIFAPRVFYIILVVFT